MSRVITPQRSLMGTSSPDMRQETDRMLTRLAFNAAQQQQDAGVPQDAIVPTPVPDGVTTKFNLPTAPFPALSLKLYAAGLLQTQGADADYTLSTRVITFNAAPAIGLKLIAWYRTQVT